MTSLIEYYAEQEGFTTNDSYKDTFVDIMTIAIEKGYWDEEAKGTYLTKLDSLVTDSFGLYGSSSKGNNDYYSLYSKICEHVDDGVPVIFSVPDHGMVACGYVTYTVTYNKNGKENKPKTVTENFVIVNDGWSDEPEKQYSYFPEGLISTNVFTRWDYCITKVVLPLNGSCRVAAVRSAPESGCRGILIMRDICIDAEQLRKLSASEENLFRRLRSADRGGNLSTEFFGARTFPVVFRVFFLTLLTFTARTNKIYLCDALEPVSRSDYS